MGKHSAKPTTKYKFLVAAAGAAFIAFQSVYTDGITNEEWITVAIAAVTAIGVFQVPNKEKEAT